LRRTFRQQFGILANDDTARAQRIGLVDGFGERSIKKMAREYARNRQALQGRVHVARVAEVTEARNPIP